MFFSSYRKPLSQDKLEIPGKGGINESTDGPIIDFVREEKHSVIEGDDMYGDFG